MQQLILIDKELPYEIAEEIKTLRTNVQFCGDDKKVILITSCFSGDGKSTLSLQLAKSITELGKTVLLIDTDLRKSVFDKKIKSGKMKFGLTHCLIGQANAADTIYQIENSGLHVMPAVVSPPNPSELLSSERMAKIIENARNAYDYVIVDSAPIGLVVDASVVAPCCDGVILVLESGRDSHKFAQESISKLKNTGCPILGTIVNKIDRKKDGYYGYGRYGKENKYEQYYRE